MRGYTFIHSVWVKKEAKDMADDSIKYDVRIHLDCPQLNMSSITNTWNVGGSCDYNNNNRMLIKNLKAHDFSNSF